MNTGKKFEKLFQESCRIQEISCTRLQDAGYRGGTDENNKQNSSNNQKRFTIRNICDFICYAPNGSRLWFLELKSRKTKITFKELDKQAARLLKKYQENDKLHECGFLFEFSEQKDVGFYLNIVDYEDFKNHIGRKSFGYKDDFLRLVTAVIFPGKRTPRLDILKLMREL